MSEKVEESCETEDRECYEVECDDEVEYYVKAFKRLDETGKHTWNWAACIFGSAWMAYRKMYLYALSFVIIIVVFRLCAFSLISFSMYGNFLLPNLFKDQHPILYQSIFVCSWGICCVFTGYFGNALYYRAIKKKIRKGYHLLREYCPISILSWLCVFYSPLICFADWISRKSQLKTEVESEVNEETIRAYLNPNKKNHIAVKIANILVCLLLIGAVAKIFTSDYRETRTRITTEKKI
jgi:hypothetical protein